MLTSVQLRALLELDLWAQVVKVQGSCHRLPLRPRPTPMPLRLFDADGAGVRPPKGRIPGFGVADVMDYAAGVVTGMPARTS